mmetsp:Transcript_807/g.988  ORF Transcript_807/g.988 Transcript_807/m.988 type:complete len:247 (-) Transcript_807:202-942(-)
MQKPCQLFFQVKSRDSWERHRTEGYAYVNVPMEAGTYDFSLRTWKVGGSIRQKSSEYFIGGALQLDKASYTAIPYEQQGPFLNRYGFNSETSGSIRIKLNIVKQVHLSREEIEELEASELLGADPKRKIVTKTKVSNSGRPRVRSVEEIISSLKFGTRKPLSGQSRGGDLVASLSRLRAQKHQDTSELKTRKQEDKQKEDSEQAAKRAQIQAKLQAMKTRMKRNRSSTPSEPRKSDAGGDILEEDL